MKQRKIHNRAAPTGLWIASVAAVVALALVLGTAPAILGHAERMYLRPETPTYDLAGSGIVLDVRGDQSVRPGANDSSSFVRADARRLLPTFRVTGSSGVDSWRNTGSGPVRCGASARCATRRTDRPGAAERKVVYVVIVDSRR
jgi:hypothetical protein